VLYKIHSMVNGWLRPFLFFFLSILLLVATAAEFHANLLPVILVCYLTILVLPFLYEDCSSISPLAGFQFFYIAPLLVSVTLSRQYWRAEYLLQLFILIAGTFLCACEIAQNKKDIEISKKHILLFAVIILLTWYTSEAVLQYANISKILTLIAVIISYIFIDTPSDKLLKFHGIKNNNIIVNYLCWAGLIISYILTGIFGKAHFLIYILYLVSVINLCFSFRDDKKGFLIFAVILVLASMSSFVPKETHIDSLLLSCVIMLFYLKSPVLYYKNGKYGEVKVVYEYRANKISLISDGVIQGEKILDSDNSKTESLRYFGGKDSDSVISSIFKLLDEKRRNIAVLGLGTGALSMFGRKQHSMHFYEINPEIVKIAYTRHFFDYIATSEAKIKVILGDAREKLNEAKDGFYDLICVDVYFGDSMPKHFVTLEAMQMYLDKLTKDGLLVFHATGQNMEEFEHRISRIASNFKLVGQIAYDRYAENESKISKRYHGLLAIPREHDLMYKVLKAVERFADIQIIPEHKEEVYAWVVFTKNKSYLKELDREKRWYKLASKSNQVLYTDDIIGYKLHRGEITSEVR